MELQPNSRQRTSPEQRSAANSAGRRNHSAVRPNHNARITLRRGFPLLLVVGLLVFIVVSGGVFSSPRSAADELTQSSALNVATIEATLVSGYEVPREFTGQVEARRESLLSLELGGLVLNVLVDEGDQVEQGDVLAKLDTELLLSRRDSVAARLAAAQALLDEMIVGPRVEVIEGALASVERWSAQSSLAAITKNRNLKLVNQNAVSRQVYDDSTFGQQALDAQLNLAKAKLRELENGTRKEEIVAQRATVLHLTAELDTVDINVRKSNLIAPYSGIVSERLLDEGMVIDAGTPVVQLLETGTLDVRVGVSEDALPRVIPGEQQSIIIRGKEYAATVRSVRPDRNQATRTVSALLTLNSIDTTIHVGDLARLRIESRIEEPGFWLPISSLTENYRGLWGAFVTIENGDSESTQLLELRELEVLHQTSDAAFVRGSLHDGDRVVATGIQRLVPGQLVRRNIVSHIDAVASTASLR